MSLSKDALDTLTATAIAASGAPLDTHVPAILVPKDYQLQPVEHLQHHPVRFRGAFSTRSIPAFAEYVQHHAVADQSYGFIDQSAMSAQVIFDLGDAERPLFGQHTARIELIPSPAYLAVQQADGKTYAQLSLTEFIEDWAPHITAIGEHGDIPLPSAIDAIRRMRIETKTARDNEIGDFNAKRSALEEIEAKSQGQLPRFLEFTCTPYEALEPITIRFRVSVLTGAEGPQFRLRWVNKEAQMEAIARNFRHVLSAAMDSAVPLTEGVFTKATA